MGRRKKKKGKRIENEHGEIPLPEAIIQHVQSYLSGKEAARTTILSKSWYAAWLTRPFLDLDYNDFPQESLPLFEEYAKKTVQRYHGSNLKIERFRLRMDRGCSWARDLIVNAINIGATDVELEFSSSNCILPKEVLGSKTLLRLSLSGCRFDVNSVRCSSLQSLSLDRIKITSDDGFKDIISCCGSIEELSVSECYGLTLSLVNLYELHMLRRLSLYSVDVDGTFFTDFASRFPCLQDLAILDCDGCTRIRIASASLQTIHFSTTGGSWKAKFNAPNIRKFSYSGSGLPSQLSIKGASTEWELDISIECNHFPKNSWFLKLKKLLTKFRLSRISLCLNLEYECKEVGLSEHDLDIEVLPKPLVLENLMISAPSSLCCVLLRRLFGICRPKYVTEMSYSWSDDDECYAIICNRLLQRSVTPNCRIPDQDMFEKFGLKKVNMEVYEMADAKWLPLMLEEPLDPSKTWVNDQEVRFELVWD